MTNGIIQEEFNKFRSHYLGISITHERLCYLERHIIEKIKEKRVWQWDAVSLKDLIGDTE